MDGLTRPAVAAAAPLTRWAGRGVSVIIPALEECARLQRAIASVRATADLPYQLVVSRARQCVAKNRNAGLSRATQDLVAFLDDDVVLAPGWMSRLASALEQHADIGAASAHLVFPDGSPQSRRPALAPGELWEVTIPGTCFMYSRARVGDTRFDERYVGSQWEDTDWMWRVQRRGLRTVVVGGVTVVHDHDLRENQWLAENRAHFEQVWGRLPGDAEAHAISREGWAAWQAPADVRDATLITVDVEPDWGASTRGGDGVSIEALDRALPLLLERLARVGARATFFVVGELAEEFTRRFDAGAGHEVGAHGLTHRRLPQLPQDELDRELLEARARLVGAGFDVQGFRAPFLSVTLDMARRLARAGYRYDASAGALGPSRHNRRRASRGPFAPGDVARPPTDTLRVPFVPCNLTWLRLLDPLGLPLLPRRPRHFSLHLHELLPATRGLSSLPPRWAALHARGCGPRALHLLDRVLARGRRYLTCAEAVRATRTVLEARPARAPEPVA